MARCPRYAIYYAPAADHRLHDFGSRVLGYDACSGGDVPVLDGLDNTIEGWHDLTRDARKYGFHATLKAPFSLARGQTEAGLRAACTEFAAKARQIPVIVPVIGSIDGFIAVIPAAPVAPLATLARDCVADFDHLRAPLTEDDRNRRNPSALTPRQRDYLDRWGYPYVMDEFRFHMTLTTRLSGERGTAVLDILRERFSRLDLTALTIDRIVLFRQHDAAGRFAIVDQFPMSAAAASDALAPADETADDRPLPRPVQN